MYGVAMLQLWFSVRSPTELEMKHFKKDYQLSESSHRLCRIGLRFEEPVNDDIPTDVEQVQEDSNIESYGDDIKDTEQGAKSMLRHGVWLEIREFSFPYFLILLLF